jgi:hypothetical protein
MRTCCHLPRILILACAIVVFAFPLSGSQAATWSTETSAVSAVAVDYFFHGVPEDQANKNASFVNLEPPPAGSLTFNQSNTFDAAPVAQTMGSPNSEFIPNELAVWWTGPFSGTINGMITFNWFWQTSNADGIAQGVALNVKVVADPDFANPGVGTQTVIGDFDTTFLFSDTLPAQFTTEVPVSGTVTNALLIQVATSFVNTGPGLTALYDHAMFPSKMSIPSPTAATLLSFTGKATGRSAVKLTWQTASEVDAIGYNVWRFGSSGKPVKVNRVILAAKTARGIGGARYSLLDPRVQPGAYTYRLQVVSANGTRAWRASATVRVR